MVRGSGHAHVAMSKLVQVILAERESAYLVFSFIRSHGLYVVNNHILIIIACSQLFARISY